MVIVPLWWWCGWTSEDFLKALWRRKQEGKDRWEDGWTSRTLWWHCKRMVAPKMLCKYIEKYEKQEVATAIKVMQTMIKSSERRKERNEQQAATWINKGAKRAAADEPQWRESRRRNEMQKKLQNHFLFAKHFFNFLALSPTQSDSLRLCESPWYSFLLSKCHQREKWLSNRVGMLINLK